MKNTTIIMKSNFIFLALAIFGFFTGSVFAQPANDNFVNAETVSGIRISLTRTNVDATKQLGEPNHASNNGGKSVWFKWTAPMDRAMNVTTARSQTTLDPLLAVYSGTAFNNLSFRGASTNIDNTNLQSSFIFIAQAGTTYYIAVDGTNIGGQISQGDFTLDIKPSLTMRGADYDGDGMTDLSVFRESTGTWFHLKKWTQQTVSTQWGTFSDIPVVMTQGKINDKTIYRRFEGNWYRLPSNTSQSPSVMQWGLSDDIPVPEMYGGGASAQTAVFRQSNGTWYITDILGNHLYYRFGLQNDIPVPGQYSADDVADIAVFRPSNGTWYFTIRIDNNPSNDTFKAVKFGQFGDRPATGDYDGDGILDIAVYRRQTGTWWILQSSDGQVSVRQFGNFEDIHATGDYDGDGKFDLAVFRPTNGIWYIHMSESNSVYIKEFGQFGDIPVTAHRSF